MRRKQTDYKILALPTGLRDGLAMDVRDSMKHGWETLGAPFYSKIEIIPDTAPIDCLVQAMVKYDQTE